MNEMLLVAQQQSVPEEAIALAAILAVIAIVLAIQLAIAIAICAMLYVCFKRVPAEHRKLEPGLVWLLLIPLFAVVWNFFVFLRLPESFQSYFAAQGRRDVGDCGRGIGLWYSICVAASIVPCVNYVAGPAALVLLIIFLVKVFSLRGEIPESAVVAT